MIDMSRVHKFKKKYIENICNDKELESLVDELWIFGSTIEGCSVKKHTAFSDIDIGVLPKVEEDQTDTYDVTTKTCRNIHSRIVEDLHNDDFFIGFDIIWMNQLGGNDDIGNDIKRGLRIF